MSMRAAGPDPDRDAVRAERGPLHDERLDRRHVAGELIERPQGQERASDQGEQRQRHQRDGPGARHASASTTSKKLIQPSSTNSL
jgi:hypothetical protein